MQENNVISVLIGLIGACNNNSKTERTDKVVLKALAFELLHPNAEDNELQNIKDEVTAEKYAISPGCALCAMPCGNTSDYDMNRIYNAKEEIRTIKLQLLSELKELAARLSSRPAEESLPAESMEFIYKALTYVGCDLDKDSLLPLLEELRSLS